MKAVDNISKIWHYTVAFSNQHIDNRITNNYFNFAEGRKTTRPLRCVTSQRGESPGGAAAAHSTQRAEPTSAREYEEDAQALKAEEGRGDRRNVQGELHTSEEPCVSEWGNPPGVMPRHPVVNQLATGGAGGELKHLSNRTTRNQARFPK